MARKTCGRTAKELPLGRAQWVMNQERHRAANPVYLSVHVDIPGEGKRHLHLTAAQLRVGLNRSDRNPEDIPADKGVIDRALEKLFS